MNRERTRKLALWLIRLGIPLAILLLCLIVVEFAARIKFSQPGMHFGIEMWKYAKTIKMRASPEMSHQHRPGSQAFLMGVDVSINSHGLRDFEFPAEKPPGTYRILVLGDSTTFGWGASFDALYTKQIEKSLNERPPTTGITNYQVINAGVGNYNTAQELAYFKEKGLGLQPDMVWLAWFINDAEPTPRPKENWLAYRSYGYVWLSSALDATTRTLGEKKGYREYYRDLYLEDQPGWVASQAAFRELAGLCRERQIPLRLILLPEMHTTGSQYEFCAVHAKMVKLADTERVKVLDLAGAFPDTTAPESFWVSPGDAHHNDEAMKVIANRIDQAIREDLWIP